METTLTTELGGKQLSIQTGKLAKQASGAALVTCGETVVLVTVVSARDEKDSDFLPLSVEYMEKIYAAGRIPGNYFRREIGRPSEKEILTSRIIDRPIRPLLPKKYRCETQIVATVLSMDKETEPDMLALVGASAALHISDVPFANPIAGVRVCRINGEFKVNPPIADWAKADINVVVAGSKTGVVMVEGGANIVSETDFLDAIFFGHKAIQPLIDMQEELRRTNGKEKRAYVEPEMDAELYAKIKGIISDRLTVAVQTRDKMERAAAVRAVRGELFEELGEAYAERTGEIKELYHDLQTEICRNLILDQGLRIDGRDNKTIRPITCDVGILPRPHGSALFTRGETQVLGTLTLGTGSDEQRVETLSGMIERPFMLHYNFPPFSVGEAKRMAGPSRRDIGHGALATRAIEPILPNVEDFDYTIRLVSEVLESNGSSSMGTVCSCIMALMDGGVPIKAPVAGIAMGLISDGSRTVVLSDILGDEDHMGDMDFKVTGTKDGITACQMDIKILELSREIMATALEQAREGRIHILGKMLEAIPAVRGQISQYAPSITTMMIHPDKIRDVIGKGGNVIRSIQTETNTVIEIEDSGLVKIAALSQEEAAKAENIIKQLTAEPEEGAVYTGTVVKVADFGAFVNILPGTDGLLHISQLAKERVTKVTDVVNVGDVIEVKVLEVGKDGRIRLSRKALL